MKRGSPVEQQEFRNMAIDGVDLAETVIKLPNLAAKQKAITEEGRKLAREGKPLDRIVELLNKSEPELDNALRGMQIVGTGIVKSIPSLFDTPKKQEALARLAAVNPQAAQALLALNKQRRGKTGTDRFTKAPGVIVRNEDGSFSQIIPVLNERTGKLANRTVPIPGQPVSRLGETPTQRTERAITQAGGTAEARAEVELETAGDIAGATARGGAAEKRQQKVIDRGLEAADTIPNFNRVLNLLDSVKTGGIDAVALRVKQLFGIESEDEAELSAGLGKAVLAQLRDIFGAQFTEGEGKRLERIEAGFGKSTAGNRRLIIQAKRIMENISRRAIRAAERVGDTDAAQEIREAMEFNLDPETPEVTIPEGTTATNPETGEKIIFRGGKWQAQ